MIRQITEELVFLVAWENYFAPFRPKASRTCKLTKIPDKSQFGFLPKNGTAVHVLTLRALIDKYVQYHQEKVYACFVDFRQAFDSVWHDENMTFVTRRVVLQGSRFIDFVWSILENSITGKDSSAKRCIEYLIH